MRYRDDQWLKEIYRDVFPRIAAMVRRMGGNLDMAKDIFQDAVIIYLEKQQQHTLPDQVPAMAYLVGIARICCIRKLKREGGHISLEQVPGEMAIPADYYAPAPVQRPLLDYIKATGKRCLELLRAFYYDDLSISEIASDFQFKNPHAVSVQKYKCLEKVRTQLQQMDYAETVG